MVFSSLLFLFGFLPVVLLVYFLLKQELRNGFLLLASLFFYIWGEPRLFLLMLLVVFVTYVFGLALHEAQGVARRALLAGGVVICLSFLFYYKYINFVVDNLNALLPIFHRDALQWSPVLLPIGISFYVFHAISYLADIYRRTSAPQRNPLLLALYISFFPQLIAGPIVRYHDIADQLKRRVVEMDDLAYGMNRFAMGLGKKVLLANPLAAVSDQLFAADPGALPTGAAWLGIVCYTLQIYFDFSGYSDMAIGLARMFGFRFPENFNYPYAAQSMQQFWRRWHISLSSWFRDYVYIPLGGSRVHPAAVYRNLLIVFLLTGIWHGASWNFVVWGLIHGAFLLLERTGCGTLLNRLWRPLRHLYVALIVLLSWVFFRASDVSHAMNYLKAMFVLQAPTGSPYYTLQYLNNEVVLTLGLALIGCLPLPYFYARLTQRLAEVGASYAPWTQRLAATFKLAYLAAVMLLCFMALASNTYNPFIYFRF